ncbi:MAG: DNA-directed RNA polymerase subunit H [Candidatus Lokiarchaeota archaeon]|nr:DNA-directed RNA polymerase subunit H [Candidatus Lokiarchaeota archaeon]
MVEFPTVVMKTRSLLTLRGYEVDELFEYENRYVMHPTRTNSEGITIKMIVWVLKEPKVVGVAVARDIQRDMIEEDATRGMIVGGARFTPAAKKHSRKNGIELVEGNYASFDLFGHELVPEHTIADSDEVDLVLDHYGIDKPHLPRIRRDDPAVRVLGARTGQVIRVERDSATAGRTYYYRLVIDSKR